MTTTRTRGRHALCCDSDMVLEKNGKGRSDTEKKAAGVAVARMLLRLQDHHAAVDVCRCSVLLSTALRDRLGIAACAQRGQRSVLLDTAPVREPI